MQALFRNFLSPIFNYDTTTVFLSYLSRTSSKVATFELTLVDQAWVWFRTLNKDIVTDFLTNFAPRGSKWNPIDQLFSLKQEGSKMVREYIHRTKNLHIPCSMGDKISDDKLMSQLINSSFEPTLQNVLIVRMCINN